MSVTLSTEELAELGVKVEAEPLLLFPDGSEVRARINGLNEPFREFRYVDGELKDYAKYRYSKRCPVTEQALTAKLKSNALLFFMADGDVLIGDVDSKPDDMTWDEVAERLEAESNGRYAVIRSWPYDKLGFLKPPSERKVKLLIRTYWKSLKKLTEKKLGGLARGATPRWIHEHLGMGWSDLMVMAICESMLPEVQEALNSLKQTVLFDVTGYKMKIKKNWNLMSGSTLSKMVGGSLDPKKLEFMRILVAQRGLYTEKGFDLPVNLIQWNMRLDHPMKASRLLKWATNKGVLICIDHRTEMFKKAKTYRLNPEVFKPKKLSRAVGSQEAGNQSHSPANSLLTLLRGSPKPLVKGSINETLLQISLKFKEDREGYLSYVRSIPNVTREIIHHAEVISKAYRSSRISHTAKNINAKAPRIDSLGPKPKKTHTTPKSPRKAFNGLLHAKINKKQAVDLGYLTWAIEKSGVRIDNPQGLLDFGISRYLSERGAPMDCFPRTDNDM